MARKKRTTLNEDILGMGQASMSIASGSMIVGVPALNAPAGIKQAFPTAAAFMPVGSVAMMGKHIMNMTKKLRR